MYAYIAWDLFTNLESFFTLIDFQKKCYGKYTPKAVLCCCVIVTQKEKTQTKDGLVLQMVAKTGFVPPVNLRSESASFIRMELKYFLKRS
jgi:hypothetical protein